MPTAETTQVPQIHPEVKRQVDCSHVDTDDKLFLLMTEYFPSSRQEYPLLNPFEKMAISILRTGLVPKTNKKRDGITFNDAIERINRYRRFDGIVTFPEGL